VSLAERKDRGHCGDAHSAVVEELTEDLRCPGSVKLKLIAEFASRRPLPQFSGYCGRKSSAVEWARRRQRPVAGRAS
jgi:hypothetical protein